MTDHTYRLRPLTWRVRPTDEDGLPVFDAVCGCGWQSAVYGSEAGAQIAADQHVATAPHRLGAS